MDERYNYIIQEKDREYTVKEILKRRMGLSTRLRRKLKTQGQVWLNGKPVRQYEKAKPGDKLVVTMPAEISHFTPEKMDLDIIYEDQDILLINKKPGIVVHPTKGHPFGTLANGIMDHMLRKGQSYKIRFVNRLDMNTSGLVLIGKNSHSQDAITKQADKGQVKKIYKALVKGIILQDEGTIDLPIGRPEEDNIKRTVMVDGYPSVTHYEVVERFEKTVADGTETQDFTMVKVHLETGRTHQIRVHFNHIGHPVAGDDLYDESMEGLMERQALHAEELQFSHPASGKLVNFKAPLPEDIKSFIEWARS